MGGVGLPRTIVIGSRHSFLDVGKRFVCGVDGVPYVACYGDALERRDGRGCAFQRRAGSAASAASDAMSDPGAQQKM
ncbi:hypothetical protein LMG22931_01922 [Paraburkholderia nemoris]|nr:hypothetical protein LMG22931_01922 [Paraburkholderia nemoris]